jgi:hypothetical protein
MSTKYICDFCKTRECPDYYPSVTTLTRYGDGPCAYAMELKTNTRHICNECWQEHMRQFAEAVLAGSVTISRSRPCS